jgi:hypothetical protein
MSSDSPPAKPRSQAKHSSQGPFTLWCGATFSAARKLIKMHPAIRWNRWYRTALLPGMVAYNSLMGGLESLFYGKKIEQTQLDPAPLIVLGHWRSGTTHLYNLLCNDRRYSYSNTYQCIFPSHFLLTEPVIKPLTGWVLPKSRPMDNVPAGWECAQEDEFALCLMTMTSPYVMALRPDRIEAYGRFFNPANMTDAERREFVDAMRHFFKKLAIKDPRPLCLKSPGHTFRIPMLHEIFPNAKYVYLYRNPYAVYNSSCHLRRTMNEENSLGRCPQPNLEAETADVYEDCFRCYEKDKALIPPGNLYEMKYETLDANPLEELGKMYSSLNLGGFDELRKSLEPQLAGLKEYKKNKFDNDKEKQRQIYERLKFAFDRFDYPPPHLETESAVA